MQDDHKKRLIITRRGVLETAALGGATLIAAGGLPHAALAQVRTESLSSSQSRPSSA